MTEVACFTIGVDVLCSDGVCGELSGVVVDPVAWAVTHLIVEPKHQTGPGRLVPLDLVDAAPGEVRLRCSLAAFEKLEAAEQTELLPRPDAYGGFAPGEGLSWPYYPPYYAGGGMGGPGPGSGNFAEPVTRDSVPVGEVAVRSNDQVHATDGAIGRVQGLMTATGDHRLTHILLQEGHLWGRKEVAIPIAAVMGLDHGIRLNITKLVVQDLPPVGVDHPNR
ncbi:MAG: hypothetical protein M3083_13705 [Actinomycetota bacterium]|nr:hypothetical protein [Actinomycetota bacterium]